MLALGSSSCSSLPVTDSQTPHKLETIEHNQACQSVELKA